MRLHLPSLGIAAGLSLGAIGCGDLIGATGDEGRLRFTLYTTYEVEETDLRDVTIVGGHEQRIDVELTSKGEDEIDEPSQIRYSLTPSAGVTIDEDPDADDDDPPDIEITVDEPGDYRLEATVGTEVVDSIDLSFAPSTALELDVRVRSPWDDDFTTVPSGEVTAMEEGSQATFLPIPLDDTGDRLAGDLTTEVAADPEELVVPGASIGGVYEDGYWLVVGAIDFYFIDPGEVTITITDPVSGADGTHEFLVENVGAP
jgi:hypothetical protein